MYARRCAVSLLEKKEFCDRPRVSVKLKEPFDEVIKLILEHEPCAALYPGLPAFCGQKNINHPNTHQTANRVRLRKGSIIGRIFKLHHTWSGAFQSNPNLFNLEQLFYTFVDHTMTYLECDEKDYYPTMISEFAILLGEFAGNRSAEVIRQMEDFDTCCHCCYRNDKSVDNNTKTEFANAVTFFLQANYDAERKTMFTLCKTCLAKIVGNKQGVESTTRACTICLESPKDCLLLPCNHYCMCISCANKITSCPYCRTNVTDRRKVFEQ